MSEAHIVSALRTKRAEISGHIVDLERRTQRQRANLAHIDAAIRLLSPSTDPNATPPKRLYRRTKYFARGDLSKRCLEVLRKAEGTPMTAPKITAIIMNAKGLPTGDVTLSAAINDMVLPVLRSLCKRGTIVKSGTSRNAQWSVGSVSV